VCVAISTCQNKNFKLNFIFLVNMPRPGLYSSDGQVHCICGLVAASGWTEKDGGYVFYSCSKRKDDNPCKYFGREHEITIRGPVDVDPVNGTNPPAASNSKADSKKRKIQWEQDVYNMCASMYSDLKDMREKLEFVNEFFEKAKARKVALTGGNTGVIPIPINPDNNAATVTPQ
jgi:hypothetical protein